MSHVFAVPPVVLFSDADVLDHPLHLLQLTSVQFSFADPDPGSGAFLTPGSGIRVPGWIKKKTGSGSGMNNQDHISESLEKIFGVKILKFFYADPGWKKFGSGIWDGKNSNPG